MAWSTPHLWVSDEDVTSSLLNLAREQLEDLHRRTSPVNTYSAGPVYTTSTSYADPTLTPGGAPTVVGQVVVTIGTTGKAAVTFSGNIEHDTLQGVVLLSFAVSGATTVPASDDTALGFTAPVAGGGIRFGQTIYHSNLNPGVNTFTLKTRVNLGQGTYRGLRMAVIPGGA